MNVFSTKDMSKPVPPDTINYENKKLSIYFEYSLASSTLPSTFSYILNYLKNSVLHKI